MKFKTQMVRMTTEEVVEIIRKNVQISEDEKLRKLRRYEKFGDVYGITTEIEGEMHWVSMEKEFFKEISMWPIENLIRGIEPSKEWFVNEALEWWIETFVGDKENFVTQELWDNIPTIINNIFEL